MNAFQEPRLDVMLPCAILSALILTSLVHKHKPGWQAWVLLAIHLVVLGHHQITSHSDHTVEGVVLRFGLALSATIIAPWAMARSVRRAKAIRKTSLDPAAPLARIVPFTVACLKTTVYLFVLCQAWFIFALTIRRFLNGYGRTGNGWDDVFAVIGFVTGVVAPTLIFLGCGTTAVLAVLLVVRKIKRRNIKRAKDKADAAAKKAAVKKAAPPKITPKPIRRVRPSRGTTPPAP